MSTLEATVSMLEAMPEEARLQVFEYTQNLFGAKERENPFLPLTKDQILEDLAVSRKQIDEGEVCPMDDALDELEKKYGFV